MIHYSCDRCRRSIDPCHELRYSLEIKLEARMDDLSNVELPTDDHDPLDDVQELLEAAMEADKGLVGDDICRRMRFDLCSECYRRFVRNPLGQEVLTELTFSDN